MHVRRLTWMTAILGAGLTPFHAVAGDVFASAPKDVSVTVYRDPRQEIPDGLDLAQLSGFALVSEVRTVKVPAGESRLRFEGVANGIQASSAIVTGLPTGVLEKNRDAEILSPAALSARVRTRGSRTGEPVSTSPCPRRAF